MKFFTTFVMALLSLGYAATTPSAASTQSACTQMCIQTVQPVCGSDGVTYTNICYLNKASCFNPTKHIVKLSDGACPCDTAVCQPGQTCVNEPKQCITTPCPQYSCVGLCTQMCIQTVDPVCGSDGVTYTNICYLNKAACNNPTKNIVKIASGACPCDGVQCPSGQTCVNEPKQCFTTPCPQYSCVAPSTAPVATTQSACTQMCFLAVDPVCGSDGVTYTNICFLNKAACLNPTKNIVKIANGACPCDTATCQPGQVCVNQPKQCITTPCPQYSCLGTACTQFCYEIYQPVCGSDGVTYANICFLNKAACQNPTKNITKIASGVCPCDEVQCPAGQTCVNEPKQCITTPCPQYSCAAL